MTCRLLAYLLDDLSPAERREVEQRLQSDPQLREELQRLRACLCPDEPHEQDDRNKQACADAAELEGCSSQQTHDDAPLLSDRSPLPNADLVHRTCSLVQEFHQLRPVALQCDGGSEPSGGRRRWSLADVAIAGGILFCLASLVLPAMRQNRDEARRIACQDNLRFLGTALADYFDRHQRRPHIQLGQNAGLYTAALAAEGGIAPEAIAQRVVCPSSQLAQDVASGRARVQVLTGSQLALLRGFALAETLQTMGGSYAFRVGYRDAEGKYRPVRWQTQRSQPLLADSPSSLAPGFRSVNHRGCGQNVLWADVSVRFMPDCFLADDRSPRERCATSGDAEHPNGTSLPPGLIDNLFVNREGEPAAGADNKDIVLLPSEFGPTGRIVPLGGFGRANRVTPVGANMQWTPFGR